MKKVLSFILFIIMMFSLSGCNEAIKEDTLNADNQEANSLGEINTIKDYYPFEKNIVKDYVGIGNEYAEMKTFVEYIDKDTIQIKRMNSGTNLVRVLEYKDGILREVFGEGEFYHIENMLNVNRNMDNIILKEPIQVDNSWEDRDGNIVEITSIDKEIDTPSGKYTSLEVTTNYNGNATKKEYYVKDIGLVASIYKDGDFEVKTLLNEIEHEGMEIPIKVYYPERNDTGSKYITKEIQFKTNDNMKTILEELLKNPESDKLLPSISENTNINKINLNRDTWTVEVDLSKEFKNDMNAGSTYELQIIDSIVNTLGEFYDVERVYITVEGSPYNSGHLELLENEYFQVNSKDVEELKVEDEN